MDGLTLLKAFIMGIVEGTTEFLPVSSTGHLIIAGDLMNFMEGERRHAFDIFIQLGAMMAVVWEYRAKLLDMVFGSGRHQLLDILVAFIPAAIVGLIAGKTIQTHLFSPEVVAMAFILGGIAIIIVERFRPRPYINDLANMTLPVALAIGFFQCLALIPGTSRSAATILGGMLMGLNRRAATEFSFLVGVPTLGAASLYSLFKVRDQLSMEDAGIFAVGFIAAFINAFFVIRALLKFVANHTFDAFAIYRILFGLLILGVSSGGVINFSQ